MDFSYPKTEKLKSRKTIGRLFTEGQSVSKFPLRLVFVKKDPETEMGLQIGVSVSKKYFKKAVDRNYYKRLLRECYRLNKPLLKGEAAQSYALLFLYQTRERLDFETLNEKTVQLLEKFNRAIHADGLDNNPS